MITVGLLQRETHRVIFPSQDQEGSQAHNLCKHSSVLYCLAAVAQALILTASFPDSMSDFLNATQPEGLETLQLWALSCSAKSRFSVDLAVESRMPNIQARRPLQRTLSKIQVGASKLIGWRLATRPFQHHQT